MFDKRKFEVNVKSTNHQINKLHQQINSMTAMKKPHESTGFIYLLIYLLSLLLLLITLIDFFYV